ncbi:MAG: hypothetical protein OQK78_13425 [Gammaproteobacteria bacterium]|nr:hypothetical protein [Gammaproteobacteria bacterium]
MQARLFLLLLLVGLTNPLCANPQIIETYQKLAESGASQLALEGLRAGAPAIESDPLAWSNWQRAELQILARQQWWQQLIEQIEGYSDAVPTEFISEVQRVRIEALIELNRFGEARALLLQQIWGSPEAVEDELKLWRELIVKSYISEGMSDDAYIAMQHFRNDYGVEDESSNELLIQTLLASQFPEVAEGIIDKLPDSEDKRLLKQLARLRQGKGVRAIMYAAREKLQQNGLSRYQRSMLWGIVAEAAERRDDQSTRVIALEAFLKERGGKRVNNLFKLGAGDLWSAYDSYAQAVANREQLLVGDDGSWLESARKAGKMYPLHQRSIYAHLSRHSASEESRISSQDLLVASLKKLSNGDRLITTLYEYEQQNGLGEYGQQVLSVMLDNALKARNLEHASELISLMDSPEAGNGYFVWALRKAKIFLLASNYVQSIEVIESLVDDLANTSEQNRDRLIQLIFDLQTAKQDAAAIRLLTKIDSQLSDPKLHRELLYWIADSNMSLENYRLAAQGYLQSAIVTGIHSMDPWAQTARYQAAKALLKADLKIDAKAIYEQLLKHTKNASRRALLKQELEQIHLH